MTSRGLNPLLCRPDARLHLEVLEDASSDACFLMTQWEHALFSPRYTLAEVMHGPEKRLRAYLGVLEAGGPEVLARMARPSIEEEDAEKSWVAAWVLLARGTDDDVAAVLDVLQHGDESQRMAVARALELSERPGLAAHLLPLMGREVNPDVAAAVLHALTVRGESPGAEVLVRALAHPRPELRMAALHAARRFPQEANAAGASRGLDSAAPEQRAAALVAGLIQNPRTMWRACREATRAPDVAGRTARLLVALGGEATDVERLVPLLAQPALRADTLWALGFSGRVSAVEACVPWLDDASLGPLAAEAFSSVTGLKLEGRTVRKREDGEEDEALPTDERTPEWPGPDNDLPVPVASEVERWWAENREDFDTSKRYLGGHPYTAARLLDALETAPMRRRGPLALELTLRTGGALGVETRTWATVQHVQLQAARAWEARMRMHALAS
ncbi:TIGR02270 family protein [Myxococcus sp. RHSTA-1-4]|uniref:TIGR02270 family protein n=1 Tax=Myxococcus sp. RHSTA-1-4 TaxID=2874601 RepID=UPI001CC11328|nr:TIGR02270 family protein [Myxococcus sp. RHSTA-1-4]MBZ4417962.1 TIGR02270 family protein [Myxococcus sp. RHSTA-1-4]